MEKTELESRATRINNLVVSAITQRSNRDRQKSLGPSELGDPCEFCLSEKILVTARGQDIHTVKRYFSFAAWVGTAIHEKLDKSMSKLDVRTEREITLKIADLSGIGEVWGHSDLYIPEWFELVDYKTKLNKEKIEALLQEEELFWSEGQVSPRLEKMWDQLMLYGFGAEATGRPVETVSLVFLPRYSDSTEEIRTITRAYDTARAGRILDRVERLAEQVRVTGVTDLASHPDCFTCNYRRV